MSLDSTFRDTCREANDRFVADPRVSELANIGKNNAPAAVVDPPVAESAADLAGAARRDQAETVRDVRMGKRAAQDKVAMGKDFEFKMAMARAAESLKLKGKGRRRMVRDWTLAEVTP